MRDLTAFYRRTAYIGWVLRTRVFVLFYSLFLIIIIDFLMLFLLF